MSGEYNNSLFRCSSTIADINVHQIVVVYDIIQSHISRSNIVYSYLVEMKFQNGLLGSPIILPAAYRSFFFVSLTNIYDHVCFF